MHNRPVRFPVSGWLKARSWGSPNHQPVAECLTTHPVFVNIRFAVGDPDPPHACWCTPHAVTGLGPDLGLAGAFEPLLRGLPGLATGRLPVIVLIPSAEHLDRLTCVVVLWSVRPAHAQDRVPKATLESCGALTHGAETRTSLFP